MKKVELVVKSISLIEVATYGSFPTEGPRPDFPSTALRIQASGIVRGTPHQVFPHVHVDLPVSLEFHAFNPEQLDVKVGDKIKVTIG